MRPLATPSLPTPELEPAGASTGISTFSPAGVASIEVWRLERCHQRMEATVIKLAAFPP